MSSPMCDLVLLSWNHLEQTQPCLKTLFESTSVPSRLFLVDNGSTPDVRQFLSEVKPRGMIQEVILLQNEKNEGFPLGMNRGIQASTAPFVCLLNNDLLFTKDWLKELLHVAQTHPTVGVLNPSSSTFGDVPPKGMSFDTYAASLYRRHGEFTEVGMCIGFCMLIKREVLDLIGGLSEEVERAFFEDEDFCMRVQAAGFKCVVAAASYVYHVEHTSVRDLPEREALFTRNRRWCHQKWGRWLRIAWLQEKSLTPGSPSLRRWVERILECVRQRIHVYVYSPSSIPISKEKLFESVGIIPHADFHWNGIASPFMASWIAAAWILKRRKKPFDIIAVPTTEWQRRLEPWRWWHRAEVILQSDEHRLKETISHLRQNV